jgi:hypothetical protein
MYLGYVDSPEQPVGARETIIACWCLHYLYTIAFATLYWRMRHHRSIAARNPSTVLCGAVALYLGLIPSFVLHIWDHRANCYSPWLPFLQNTGVMGVWCVGVFRWAAPSSALRLLLVWCRLESD